MLFFHLRRSLQNGALTRSYSRQNATARIICSEETPCSPFFI